MIDIKDNTIAIMDDDGNEDLWKILFFYTNEERGKTFYFIFKDESPDEIVVMASKDGESLETPTEEEYAEAEEVFAAYEEDPKIQEIK
ncbi:MAG: hypothetical protein IJ247_01530 [Bacilli bacterium]|nr:hypothetical protein [Bacilli bacterium]